MNPNLHVNKTNFHMEDSALVLALKQRQKATRKSPIHSQQLADQLIYCTVYILYSGI